MVAAKQSLRAPPRSGLIGLVRFHVRFARKLPESADALRDHLARALDWEEAHVGFDKAVDGIPPDKRGAVPAGFEHSPWQLLEHMRIAQEDILDFCVNPNYEHTMKWPDDYWPQSPAPPSAAAWTGSIASYTQIARAAENSSLVT